MKIELITPEEHAQLLSIYENYPALTFQNEGYQYIKEANLSDEDKAKREEVTAILKKSICEFREFNNFKLSKKTQEIQIRFQYNWNYDGQGLPFTGVGYILLDELLNGFRELKN
jgi:hypothetical protein